MPEQIVFVLRVVQKAEPWISPRVIGVYSSRQKAVDAARMLKRDRVIEVWETWDVMDVEIDAVMEGR